MSKLLLILAVAALTGVLTAANIPISRSYPTTQNNVLGTDTSEHNLKIATDSDQPAFMSNHDGAVSKFPLKIDAKTNSLMVTTPKGEKTVTVLPDAAIDNMLTSGVMNYVTSVPSTGELASTDKLITLIEMDKELVYEIDGVRVHKLLGFIPLKSKVKAYVSADNGAVIKTKTSLLGRLLNRIAP